MKSLVWFRNDLRVHDHPALDAAAQRGEVQAVYCICLDTWRSHDMSDWRLALQLRGLRSLSLSLARLGIPLAVIDAGNFANCPRELSDYCLKNNIQAIDFIDEYPFDERKRDSLVSQALADQGVAVHRHVGDVVVAPGQVLTGDGDTFSVFTPFYRKWIDHAQLRSVVPAPAVCGEAVAPALIPDSWDGVPIGFGENLWPGGEDAAHVSLGRFIEAGLKDYPRGRDTPGDAGTSAMSAHLAVGTISATQCMTAVNAAAGFDRELGEGVSAWVRELAWRDFYRHIVASHDRISKGSAFRTETNALPWRHAPDELAAWQEGRTGYPFVDAAMRQLVSIGWMHNRLRMVTAMFLTKHLLIDWRLGERFFMQHLVDGDFASNNGGWQWSASTGTEAAPYFRIFNPATQGERFDPQGKYTHRYLPELAGLTGKQLYQPPVDLLDEYPQPVVDHKEARERALAFFKANR